MNSETRRKPKKAKLNTASRILVVFGEKRPELRLVRHMPRRSLVRGCLVSGLVGGVFCRPLIRRDVWG